MPSGYRFSLSHRTQASPLQRGGLALLLGLAGTLLAVGCRDFLVPGRHGPGVPNFWHGGTHFRITGQGTLGAGIPTPGNDRQEFAFDVEDLGGWLFYRDWAVVRGDSTVATLTVDPTDPSTAITAFRSTSAACADPARGAEFDGTVRMDNGSLTSFTVSACDNGPAGSGADFFQMVVPAHAYSQGRLLSSGDVVKSGTAQGNHYYVSPSGSDLNLCTPSAPCFTMERVSQLLSPGAIAHFAPGTYQWSKPQIVSKSGTATARVTYISDAKWGAKLIVSGTINDACGIMKNTGDYVDIIGFDMTMTVPPNCIQGGGLFQDGNYGRIIGNRVHDLNGPVGSGWGGISVDCCQYTLTGNEVIGNAVDNIGPPLGASNLIHGIYLAGPGNSAVNNIVTRASAACISSYHGATRLIISNNVAANCGRYGIQISADSFAVPGGTRNDSTTVSNNIVVNNGQIGIHEYCEAPAQGPARVGPSNVYYNNIVYNNPGHFVTYPCGGGTKSGTDTLTAAEFSALFVNYTGDMNGDYDLRSGAVAIDAGTTMCAPGVSDCAPLTDFDGDSRPQGTSWDIGADESHLWTPIQPGPAATIIFQEDFESDTWGEWREIADSGLQPIEPGSRYSKTTNAGRVKSGTRSLEALYTTGTNGAYGSITRSFPGHDEVYVKFHVMFEEGFQNRRPDGWGMHFFVLAGDSIAGGQSSFGKAGIRPSGTDFFYAGVDPEQSFQDPTLRPFQFYTYWPAMVCPPDYDPSLRNCSGKNFSQQSPKASLIGGQWQEVVFHIKLNTPGQSNGSQALWINGIKKIDMQNMRWRDATSLRLNRVRFDNYMNIAPKTEHVWVDDVIVWRP